MDVTSDGTSTRCDEKDIPFRKIPNQNIVHRLYRREHFRAKPGTTGHRIRNFYTNVFPSFTVMSVEKPACYLRKFSPDGKSFIAFSADQTSIQIYQFQGPAAAEHLLNEFPEDPSFLPANNERGAQARLTLFDTFFKLRHSIRVASGLQHLNRECSLFTADSAYVIVGSAAPVPDDPHPYFYDVYRNNESLSPNQARMSLENYTLNVVSMECGTLTDSRELKVDKVVLSHNQGLYLYGDTLAVLSIQHQTIHIYQITADGYFVDIRTIGRFCYEDDEFMLGSDNLVGHTGARRARQPFQPYTETNINSLKHRLLAFLYKTATLEGNPEALRRFYKYFDQYQALRMFKMQLLDEKHLLIRYASEDVVSLRAQDPTAQPCFFVVYNMVTTQVVAVFENTSERFLELFESFSDLFRNAGDLGQHLSNGQPNTLQHYPCSSSSNIHARQLLQRFKQTILNARYGGQCEAVKRTLAQLPISSQSFSSSPYLDLALFSYDDKWISNMERPKTCGDFPIRIYGRDSGLLKFKIYAGQSDRGVSAGQSSSTRRLVAFTFHPTMPFAISVQRVAAEYFVNFHVRHSVS